MLQVLSWSAEGGLEEGTAPADVEAHAGRPDRIVWVDFSEPTPEETALLRARFDFHPLALEDSASPRQHPKIEDFHDYVFILTHGIHPDSTPRDFRTRQLSLFVGRSALVTVHHEPSRTIEQVSAAVRRNPRVMAEGPDELLHLILDVQVDQYLLVLDGFGTTLDDIEERIFEAPTREVLSEVLEFKRALMRFRRIAGHERDILARLVRGEFPAIDAKCVYGLRDVLDHLVRIADLSETYRELSGSALEAHLGLVSQRTNEAMRVLTVISSLFIPLTFIVGVYGMNFEHMPELRWRYGYAFTWIAMLAVAGGMWWFFRKRGLSGGSEG